MSERPKPILQGQHLLGIEALSHREIDDLLSLSDRYVELSRHAARKHATLSGRTQVNLFFEASTRTQSSFEIGGKRLGADVINMATSTSALAKGETVLDTAMTINAMRPENLSLANTVSQLSSSPVLDGR